MGTAAQLVNRPPDLQPSPGALHEGGIAKPIAPGPSRSRLSVALSAPARAGNGVLSRVQAPGPADAPGAWEQVDQLVTGQGAQQIEQPPGEGGRLGTHDVAGIGGAGPGDVDQGVEASC